MRAKIIIALTFLLVFAPQYSSLAARPTSFNKESFNPECIQPAHVLSAEDSTEIEIDARFNTNGRTRIGSFIPFSAHYSRTANCVILNFHYDLGSAAVTIKETAIGNEEISYINASGRVSIPVHGSFGLYEIEIETMYGDFFTGQFIIQ